MLRRRLAIFRLHFRGRAGCWLALVGQVCALIGLPLPPAGAKDSSKPFPCQHRACGCMKADDCWKCCCCFSAGDRVAWAEEHGVVAPHELIEQAKHETSGERFTKPCCSKKAPAQRAKHPAARHHLGWLLTIHAKRCQGGMGDEAGPSVNYPPSAPVAWKYEWAASAALPILSEMPLSLSYLPPLPPPRDF